MKASETKLQQIIEGAKQYLVPLFQRPYSWDKVQWEALWSDIVELYTMDAPHPHFMGSIVTMPTQAVPEGVSKFLLIDGQQRLTTIFIVLSALRDRAKELELKLAEEINHTLLVNPFKEGSDYYKLEPTELKSDREAFHHIINLESHISGSGISECYLFFKKRIIQSDLELQKIKKVICNNLSLVSIVLDLDDNPYLVFESLNAKGMPLTQADLIRNYLFMRIDISNQKSVYTDYWQPMQEMLKNNLTDFFRHYLNKSGFDIKQSEIYFATKDRINKSDALSYLKDLYIFAEYYARLLEPKREQNENVRKYLDHLKRLDIATVYPFILNCYHDWVQSRIAEEEFISVLQIIENFLIRRFICNVQTRGLNRIFALLYSEVSKRSSLASDDFIKRLKLSLQSRNYPKDAEFKARLMDVKLYGGNRSEKTKLILESIEESFKHKEKVFFGELSIEHIMPQTLSEWWREHLGEDWAITYELYLHSLGNLTLTAYNPELSNNDFIQKKNHYNNSHLELNKYFHKKEFWRREDIEERAEYLADRALQIWDYFGEEQVKPSEYSILTGTTPKLLRIFGQEYSVKSWRDVLETTLNAIYDLKPERFTEIMQYFPRFIGQNEKDFRSTRKLKNGVFIEVNLSAKDIDAFCRKAIETAELSSEEWYVETFT